MKHELTNKKKEHGMLGRLYDILKEENILVNIEDFLEFLFQPYNRRNNNNFWAYLANYDYLTNPASLDLKSALSNSEVYQDNIYSRVVRYCTPDQQHRINQELAQIVSDVTIYCSKRTSSEATFQEYEPMERQRLLTYYQLKSRYYSLKYNIYVFIHLAVYKYLPVNFFFGARYHEDLNEFNQKVVCKYGATSRPGNRAIIALADKNNLFAVYEYADLIYYGRISGQEANAARAFILYRKAAGIDDVTEDVDESACHPLALWSLAYIHFNYHRKGTNLENCAYIYEVDRLTEEQRFEKAIIYAQRCMTLIDSDAAANMLGKLSQVVSEPLKIKYQLESPDYYFTFAAEHGYVYANNNLANIQRDLIFTDPDHAEEHLDLYIKYLSRSAHQYEPWAANRLGYFYATGIIESVNKEHQYLFIHYVNPDKALEYFHLATDYFNDVNTAWAYTHMILLFPEQYKDKEDLLKEHIQRVVQLNNPAALQTLQEEFRNIYDPSVQSIRLGQLLEL